MSLPYRKTREEHEAEVRVERRRLWLAGIPFMSCVCPCNCLMPQPPEEPGCSLCRMGIHVVIKEEADGA